MNFQRAFDHKNTWIGVGLTLFIAGSFAISCIHQWANSPAVDLSRTLKSLRSSELFARAKHRIQWVIHPENESFILPGNRVLQIAKTNLRSEGSPQRLNHYSVEIQQKNPNHPLHESKSAVVSKFSQVVDYHVTSNYIAIITEVDHPKDFYDENNPFRLQLLKPDGTFYSDTLQSTFKSKQVAFSSQSLALVEVMNPEAKGAEAGRIIIVAPEANREEIKSRSIFGKIRAIHAFNNEYLAWSHSVPAPEANPSAETYTLEVTHANPNHKVSYLREENYHDFQSNSVLMAFTKYEPDNLRHSFTLDLRNLQGKSIVGFTPVHHVKKFNLSEKSITYLQANLDGTSSVHQVTF